MESGKLGVVLCLKKKVNENWGVVLLPNSTLLLLWGPFIPDEVPDQGAVHFMFLTGIL